MTNNSFVFDNVLVKAFAGTVQWPNASDKIYVVLGIPTTPPTDANKYTWATYDDIDYTSAGVPFEIATVNGYASGAGAGHVNGAMDADAPVLTTATHVVKYPAGAATVFTTTGTITATYAATMYCASTVATTDPIISNHDFVGTNTATNGTLTLTWSSNGVWSITSSAPA